MPTCQKLAFRGKLSQRLSPVIRLSPSFVANKHHSFTFVSTFSVVVVDLPTDCILSFLFPAENDVLVPVFPSQQMSSSWTSSWFLSSLIIWRDGHKYLCHKYWNRKSLLATRLSSQSTRSEAEVIAQKLFTRPPGQSPLRMCSKPSSPRQLSLNLIQLFVRSYL